MISWPTSSTPCRDCQCLDTDSQCPTQQRSGFRIHLQHPCRPFRSTSALTTMTSTTYGIQVSTIPAAVKKPAIHAQRMPALTTAVVLLKQGPAPVQLFSSMALSTEKCYRASSDYTLPTGKDNGSRELINNLLSLGRGSSWRGTPYLQEASLVTTLTARPISRCAEGP